MKIITCFLLSLMLVTHAGSALAESVEITQTINLYSEALKKGDVNAIKSLVDGEFYKKNRSLLEQNSNYPEFLRNHFQRLELIVEEVLQKNDAIADVRVKVTSPNGNGYLLYLKLKYFVDGGWKIVKESRQN